MIITSDKYREEEILQNFRKIFQKLEKFGLINLLDYEKFKFFKKNFELNGEFEEKESSGNLRHENIVREEIKKEYEKIMGKISGKKEYEFISDYFIGEEDRSMKNWDKEYIDDEEGNNKNHEIGQDENINPDEINEVDLFLRTDFNYSNLVNTGNFSDFIKYTSKDFLKRIKLDESEIKRIKANEKIIESKEDFKENVIPESPMILKESEENIGEKESKKEKENTTSPSLKNYLDITHLLLKKEEQKQIDSKINKVQMEKIEKEMDEEINNEVFGYTKRMKESAQHIQRTLIKDNKKLDVIDKLQNVNEDKTKKENKSLTDLNKSLSISWWRLLLMIAIVLVSFIMSLLTIRIVPKFV
jgi:hypothetical protein